MRTITCFIVLFLSIKAISQQTILVSFPAKQSSQPLDGRLLLLLSNNNRQEPRFQITDDAGTQLVFGLDVDTWPPANRNGLQQKNSVILFKACNRYHPAIIMCRPCCTATRHFTAKTAI